MNEIYQKFKSSLKTVDEWLFRELSAIRTGQATVGILDGLSIEIYGAKMSIKQLGTVSFGDVRTLIISPWDVSNIKAIEKSIISSNLGLSAQAGEKDIKVIFPSLTSERRVELAKLAKDKLEQARISVRKEREKAIHTLEKSKDEDKIGEDEFKRGKAEIQKITDEMNKNLESRYLKKTSDIETK